MKLFDLVRDEDVSGVSGIGNVAEIVEFSNGKVIVAWLPHTAGVPNVIVYDRLEHVEKIHGHGGRTRIVER